MGQLLILIAVALVAAALAWGVAVLLLGRDQGLEPAEPDGRAIPLPSARPLTESDLGLLRFDTAARGYRMAQVDQALRRAAYDIGYKEELISVLEAEVAALREGRVEEAESLRQAREAAQRPRTGGVADDEPEDEPASVAAAAYPDGLDAPVTLADEPIAAQLVAGRPVAAQPVDTEPEDVEPDDAVDDDLPDDATRDGLPDDPTRDDLPDDTSRDELVADDEATEHEATEHEVNERATEDDTAVDAWAASGARGTRSPGEQPADGEK